MAKIADVSGPLELDGVGDRAAPGLLGLALEPALDLGGLGQLFPSLAFTGAGEAGLLGAGLGGGDGGCLQRLGPEDRRVLLTLGLLLDGVALGVGRLADLGVELALLERGLALGHQLLGGDDVLVLGRLGHGAGGGGVGRGGVGQGLDLGLLERQLAVGDGDLLLGLEAGLLGLPPGDGLGDGGLLLGRAASGRPRSRR